MFVIKRERFEDFVRCVEILTPECRIFVDNGFEARHTDTSNVAMVMARMDKSEFLKYEPEAGLEQFCCDLKLLKAVLPSMGDEIRLEFTDGYLTVKGGMSLYTHRLLDTNVVRKSCNKPAMSQPVEIVVGGANLNDILKAADKIGDKITITKKNETVTLKVEGDTDSLDMIFEPCMATGPDSQSMYSIDFLSGYAKQFKDCEVVTLNTNTNSLLHLKASTNGILLEYVLAPRVDSDLADGAA